MFINRDRNVLDLGLRSWGTGETLEMSARRESDSLRPRETYRHQWLRRWGGRAWQQNLESRRKKQHNGLEKMVLLMSQAENIEELSCREKAWPAVTEAVKNAKGARTLSGFDGCEIALGLLCR